jgi:hypothetical protein
MKSYTQPLLVADLGRPEQVCHVLQPLPLRAGSTGALYDEGWLQQLIQDHPALLPLGEIEPGFLRPIPICMELQVPSGRIDNLMLTPEGGIVVVETKLWRNPEARREVVGQVLDYAKDLASLSYEDLQSSVRTARKEPDLTLFDLVSAGDENAVESHFIDAVSRNLRLGRMVLIIAGDGIQEGTEQLAGFLQRHVGLHFTLSLVEMSLWRSPNDGRVLVQPRILTRTVQIERAVVRVEAGVALSATSIEPSAPKSTGGSTLTEIEFYEKLGLISPDLPLRLQAFLSETKDLGVFADVKRNLSLKWRGPDGQEYHLGNVDVSGTVVTDYCNWGPEGLGRVDLSHAYLDDLRDIVPGGEVRRTPKPKGWRVVTPYGDPKLADLLDGHTKWADAIARFTDAIREALIETR